MIFKFLFLNINLLVALRFVKIVNSLYKKNWYKGIVSWKPVGIVHMPQWVEVLNRLS